MKAKRRGKRTFLLGIDFDDERNIEEASEYLTTASSRMVVTPNVDHIIRFNDKRAVKYRNSVLNATDCYCDSRVLAFISKFSSGGHIRNVVTGSDLTRRIFESYCESKSVLIIGGVDGDLSAIRNKYCVKELRQIIPSMGFINDEEEIKELEGKVKELEKIDLIFVSVGSPQQEILADRLMGFGQSFNCVCVGAAIDFLVGRQTRAPKIFQAAGLEWLYRAFTSPMRLGGRYALGAFQLVKLLAFEKRGK